MRHQPGRLARRAVRCRRHLAALHECNRSGRGQEVDVAGGLDALVGGWTIGIDADELLALLADRAVPAGRVHTAADMVTDPHYEARGIVERLVARAGFDVPMTGVVPRFTRTPGPISDVGPGLGEHTDEVLSEMIA